MSDIVREHFDDWREQIGRASKLDNDFLSYFDTSESVEQAYMQGQWDFAHHILKDDLLPLIGEPFDAKALEVGFGGGRLLAAASRYFSHVYGVDIHKHFSKVEDLLRVQQIDNFTLLEGNGSNIPVESQSLDFVYSFIVLQHLPTIDILESYFREVKRVLKKGQPACLYIGHLPFNYRGMKYQDVTVRSVETTRENTLLLRPSYTKKLLKEAGLTLVKYDRPRKKPWRTVLGAQHYVIVTA